MNKTATHYSSQPLTDETLLQENLEFSGTAGVSANNRNQGFIPAFMDTVTGSVHLSRFANGMPAPIHVLAGLPEKLIETHGKSGAPLSIKSSVISGFVHEETFYSREEAAQATASGCLH
ncbi:MAG: hypothetical protein U9P11_03565 [Pseudomonadota bacterium]|nr:hypothetical protein [Pseudomonadota bacterium]